MEAFLRSRDTDQAPAVATLRAGGFGNIQQLSTFQGEPVYREIVSNTPVVANKLASLQANDTGVALFVDNKATDMERMRQSHLRRRRGKEPVSEVYSLSMLNGLLRSDSTFKNVDAASVKDLLRRFDFVGINKNAASIVAAAGYSDTAKVAHAAMAIVTSGHIHAMDLWSSHSNENSYVYADCNDPNGIRADRRRLMDPVSPGVLDDLFIVLKVVSLADEGRGVKRQRLGGAAAAGPAVAPGVATVLNVLPDNYAWQFVPFVSKTGTAPDVPHRTTFVNLDPTNPDNKTPITGRSYYVGRILEEPDWTNDSRSQSAFQLAHPLDDKHTPQMDLQMKVRRPAIIVSGKP